MTGSPSAQSDEPYRPHNVAEARGVYLFEGAPTPVRIVGWGWAAISFVYVIALVFITLFYAFAPPWEDDFRMLPPPGTGALWAALALAWVVTLLRVVAGAALAGGQRGTIPVKTGWVILLVTVAIQTADLFLNLAEKVRGQPGRFTPIPLAIAGFATLAVLLWPRTLRWVWSRGQVHRPKLTYQGHFPNEQAEQLGITPPHDVRWNDPKSAGAVRGTDFTVAPAEEGPEDAEAEPGESASTRMLPIVPYTPGSKGKQDPLG